MTERRLEAIENMKALRWENSDGTAGVGIYIQDDHGCPRISVVRVEMTAPEMVELATDLLRAAQPHLSQWKLSEECCCSIDWDDRCPAHGPSDDDEDDGDV